VGLRVCVCVCVCIDSNVHDPPCVDKPRDLDPRGGNVCVFAHVPFFHFLKWDLSEKMSWGASK